MTARRNQLKALQTLEQLRQYRADLAVSDLQRANRAVESAQTNLQACLAHKTQTENWARLIPGSTVNTDRLEWVRRYMRNVDDQAEGLQKTLHQATQAHDQQRERTRQLQVALEQSRKPQEQIQQDLVADRTRQEFRDADELWIQLDKKLFTGESDAD